MTDSIVAGIVSANVAPEMLDTLSIADLLKLTGQDSSPQAIEQLAHELGYQGRIVLTPSMDNWLHSQVMARLKVSHA